MYESSRVTEEEMAQFRLEYAKAVEILKASGYDLNKITFVCTEEDYKCQRIQEKN